MNKLRLSILFVISYSCISLSQDEYRSFQTGDWDIAGNWEVNSGSGWGVASNPPANTDGAVEIRTGHTITINTIGNKTIDEVTVNGELVIDLASPNVLTVDKGTSVDLKVNGNLTNKTTSTRWNFANNSTLEIASTGTFVHTSGGSSNILDNTSFATNSSWVYRRDAGATPTPSVSNRTFENLSFQNTRPETWSRNLNENNPLTINGTFSIGVTVDLTATIDLNILQSLLVEGELTIADNTGDKVATLGGSGTVNGALTVSGTLGLGANVVSGSGDFTLSADATLKTSNADGINSSGALGSVQVTGTRTFSSAANYHFLGSTVSTVTGNFTTSPTANTVADLLISNTGGDVTLLQSLSATGNTSIEKGRLIVGNNSLTISNLSVAPAWGATSDAYIVVETGGAITQTIGTQTLFPIGTASFYMPCRLTGSGSYTINLADVTGGTSDPTQGLTKQWVIDGSGSVTLDVQWPSLAEGINFPNPRNDLYLFKHNGSNWSQESGPANAAGAEPYTASYSGVSCCSDFTVGAQALLPIELGDFWGRAEGDKNKLQWITFSEVNSKEFILEKSTSADFSKFEMVDRIDAAGNSFSENNYSAIDYAPAAINYYRLKMMDMDGRFEYSNTILLKNEKENKIAVHPNKTSDFTTIYFTNESEQNGKISIFSTSGKLMKKWEVQIDESQKVLDLMGFSSGIYFLHFSNANRYHVFRLVKE